MSDKPVTLKIEYRKFNTFFLDYAKSINKGWLFMKMKKKYPEGTSIQFDLTVKDIISNVKIDGVVSYHGKNHKNEEGIGIKLSIPDETTKEMGNKIKKTASELYGPHMSSIMLSLID